MTSASSLLRSLLIYSICLPLAIFLGYLLAEPLTYSTFAGVGFVLFFLCIPLFLRWHHVMLAASWRRSPCGSMAGMWSATFSTFSRRKSVIRWWLAAS